MNGNRPNFDSHDSFRFLGAFRASGDGVHRFEIDADDFAAIWFDKEPYRGETEDSDNDNSDAKTIYETDAFASGFNVVLESGKLYPIIIAGYDRGGPARFNMQFFCPNESGDANLDVTRVNGFKYFFHAKDVGTRIEADRNFTETSDGYVHRATGMRSQGLQNTNNRFSATEPTTAIFKQDAFGDTYRADTVFDPTGISKLKIDEAKELKNALLEFVRENKTLSRFGVAQYNINTVNPHYIENKGLNVSNSTVISGRLSQYQSGALSGNPAGEPHLMTAFNFDTKLLHAKTFAPEGSEDIGRNETLIKRQIKTEDGDIVSIPRDFNFISPVFTNETSTAGVTGRVENAKKISGFVGGGMFFFEIGTGVATGTSTPAGQTGFNTGKYFVDTQDSDYDKKIQSGYSGGYDVFVYNNESTSGQVSLESASRNQVTPPLGETNGGILVNSFISDFDSIYNYNNVAFAFRDGHEQQPVLDTYARSVQDFEIRKKLFGPLIMRPGASDGIGTGFSDLRNDRDFSAWMTNPPLEHDAYSHKHIIKRIEVDQCYPTFIIHALYNTIAAGEDAGSQKQASIRFSMDLGFEGDVQNGLSQTPRELLDAGNSLQSIVLSQFRTEHIKDYTAIITSNYLTTLSELPDLPKNKVLKNLKVNETDIPGLNKADVTAHNLESGALVFPGNEWKEPNRYLIVRKESAETVSTLLQRDCSINYVTEVIKQNFAYPFSAVAGTTFDARSFSNQPRREYEVRLKKVLIPSNYQPLNEDGTDKRFVNIANRYGLRDIYKFKGTNNYAIAPRIMDIGEDNFEIKVKVKFGTIITDNSAYQYVFDRDGGTAAANRVAVFQRNNRIILFGRESNAGGIGNEEVDISSYSANDVFDISVKRVASKVTLTVKVGDTTVGTSTHTLSAGLNIRYGRDVGRGFYIGANAVEGATLTANSKVVDLKILKNNEVIHWYDGTVVYSIKDVYTLRDKVGGNHAKLINGNISSNIPVTETDNAFEFGKNKEIIYNGDWDGTFKLGWTDNPAWILYDIMINPMYGVGNHLDDRRDINIFRLYELGRYCDAVDSEGLFDGLTDGGFGLEPRFSANLRLFNTKNAFEVIGNIASIFRAISFWDGSSLNYTVDKPKKISAIFNNSNVENGIFNYGDTLSSARFTRVEVPYADSKDEFTIKFEYVEDEEEIRKYGVITNKHNGIGCTSRAQARRLGKYVLMSNKLETEIIGFRAGLECMFLEPGDIIRVDDEIKNFEINYGRVLEVDTTSENAGIVIENQVNSGSIMLGSEGGIYTYNSKAQKELNDLYDIVQFDQAASFNINVGENTFETHDFTGKIPISGIESSNIEQVSKFEIIGTTRRHNGLMLHIDPNSDNFGDLTGVMTGAYFNVQLNNQRNDTFKIVSIKQTDKANLFEIQALQYNEDKFAAIENNDDIDVVQNTHNIGIPKHTINRPSAPSFTTNVFQTQNLTHSVTGVITAANNSKETSYRVTALRQTQSSPYLQKVFERENDGTTEYRLDNLIDGEYKIRVTALLNPESVSAKAKTVIVSSPNQIYNKSLFKNIEPSINTSGTYERHSATGYGTGEFISQDCEYKILTVDKYDRDFLVQRLNYKIDVYAKNGDNYVLVKENLDSNKYTFSEAQNISVYGQFNSGFDLRFDLKQEGEIIDTAFYNTTVI
jgi:hypothetical protein